MVKRERQPFIKRGIIEMNAGVTILLGEGGYKKEASSPKKIDVLYTGVTRLELLKVNRIVDDADPEAFVVIQGVRDVKGGF